MCEAITPICLAMSLKTGTGGSELRSALGLAALFARGGGTGDALRADCLRINELGNQQEQCGGQDASEEGGRGLPEHSFILTYRTFPSGEMRTNPALVRQGWRWSGQFRCHFFGLLL